MSENILEGLIANMLNYIWVTSLFYVPMLTTYINPLLGLGVTSAIVLWHYRHKPFKHEFEKLEELDPREVIKPD